MDNSPGSTLGSPGQFAAGLSDEPAKEAKKEKERVCIHG